MYSCVLQNEITVDNFIFKTVTGSHILEKDIRDMKLLTFRYSFDPRNPNVKLNHKYFPSGISDLLP